MQIVFVCVRVFEYICMNIYNYLKQYLGDYSTFSGPFFSLCICDPKIKNHFCLFHLRFTTLLRFAS